MLVDKHGNQITAVSVVKYSHKATVRYNDGTTVLMSLDDIKATDGRKEYLDTLRKVRTEK